MNAQALFCRMELRDVLNRYCALLWEKGWKAGKRCALDDRYDPFVGGPMDLVARGITEVKRLDGSLLTIDRRTRLRVRDLSLEGLELIGRVTGKDLVRICSHLGEDKAMGKDVVHQEYVATFEENVENDYKHFLNNAVGVSAILDAVVGFLVTDVTTVEQLIVSIRSALAGNNPLFVHALSMAVRMAWLGRACQDGSWKESGDFVFYPNLGHNATDIDPYVVRPVLEALVEDLSTGALL